MTCWVSSVLQQLFWNLKFRKTILLSQPTRDFEIELNRLFLRLQFCRGTLADPTPFMYVTPKESCFPQRVDEQGEVLPFFSELLQTLDDKIFGGVQVFPDGQRQPFWLIGVGIGDLAGSVFNLTDLVRESLHDDVYDPLPEVLAFGVNRTDKSGQRLGFRVNYPDELDFHFRYTLTGVVFHLGIDNAGHYVSVIATSVDGENKKKWMRFDDAGATAQANAPADSNAETGVLVLYTRVDCFDSRGDLDNDEIEVVKRENPEYRRMVENAETVELFKRFPEPRVYRPLFIGDEVREMVDFEFRFAGLIDKKMEDSYSSAFESHLKQQPDVACDIAEFLRPNKDLALMIFKTIGQARWAGYVRVPFDSLINFTFRYQPEPLRTLSELTGVTFEGRSTELNEEIRAVKALVGKTPIPDGFGGTPTS
jgi:hypothetical protein